MKIFVMGCSWSHHDFDQTNNAPVDSTWPAIIAKNNTDYTVINGAIPGSSVDSYYYRLNQMVNKFGEPDHVIIQLTGVCRTFMLKYNAEVANFNNYTNNYYYANSSNMYGSHVFVTPSKLDLKTQNFNNFFNDETVVKKYLTEYFDPDFELHRYNIYKEIELLKLRFNNKVTIFSWLPEKDYDAYFKIASKNYLGSPTCGLSFKKIKKYSADNYYHFNEIGHTYVAKWLTKRIFSKV